MTKIGFVFAMMTVLFLTVSAFAIVVAVQFHVSMHDGPAAMFLNVVATMWLLSFVGHVVESFRLRPLF